MAKNNKFDHRLKNIPDKIWLKIARIEKLQGQWITGAKLSSQVLGRLKRSVLITSTGASTRIEGARLSDEDVEKLMRGINIKKFRDRDKQEVKGYYELLEKLFASWRTIKLSESTIKHFHGEILKYVEKDKTHRGDYKKRENKVHMIDEVGKSIDVLFDTTDAFLTPKEMQKLVEWTIDALEEEKFHQLLVIGNFLVEFLQIHPFQDGNGRLSRVLTNLLLLRAGYEYMPYVSHEKLIEDNKPAYYIALRKSQNTFGTSKKKQNIIPWLNFFFDIFLKQSEMAIELLSQENIDRLLSNKQLAVWDFIRKVGQATPLEISKQTKVAYPTVRQAIGKLLRLKRIERIGEGRSTSYRKRISFE